MNGFWCFLSYLRVFIILSATISNNYFPKYLGSWTSFAHKNTAAALGLSVLILAVAGIPPLSGFFSKFFVLMSVLMEQHYVFLITAVIISSIACFYYNRLIKDGHYKYFLNDL